jgi:hypothetical protein
MVDYYVLSGLKGEGDWTEIGSRVLGQCKGRADGLKNAL